MNDRTRGLTIGEGVRVDDVLVRGPAPLGRLWVPLDNGLTVLYGRNGVGKTKVLDAVASAMLGVAIPGVWASLLVSVHHDLEGWDTRLLDAIVQSINAHVADDPNSIGEFFGEPEVDRPIETSPLPISQLSEAELDAYLHRRVDQVSTSLATIAEKFGHAAGLCHSPRIALTAIGTEEHPNWHVHLSVVPTDSARFAENLARVNYQGYRMTELDDGDVFPSSLMVPDHDDEWIDHPPPVLVLFLPGDTHCEYRSFVNAGSVIGCLMASEDSGVADATLRAVRHGPQQPGQPLNLIEHADAVAFTPVESARQKLSDLSDAAKLLIQRLSGDCAAALQAGLRHPSTWYDHHPVLWAGSDPYGHMLDVADLGPGSRRWSELSISLALQKVYVDRPLTVIIDEPERTLHSAAQQQAAQALADVTRKGELGLVSVASCLVATHSPSFLALPEANLEHVSRDDERMIRLDPIDTTIESIGLTAQLGITRADALLTVRWFLFVEGEHDAAVIKALFSETLTTRHVVLGTMDGAANLEPHVNAKLVLAHSDARIRVVLDIVGAAAMGHWNDARVAAESADNDAARLAFERIARLGKPETKWLYEAGLAALLRGELHRVELVGLERHDIINYLPRRSCLVRRAGRRCRTNGTQKAHAQPSKRGFGNATESRSTP